jgi:hypothetical protein
MKDILMVCFVLLLSYGESVGQSLAEAARKEAERRKSLEQQGIEGKVIRSETLGRGAGANITTSKLPENRRAGPAREPSGGSRLSAASYRSTLRKLDHEIRRCEDRLTVLRQRHDAEQRSMSRSGRFSRSDITSDARERRFWQIQAMESRLKLLRQERIETYDAGKKAGFLPGELDGHGIMP